MKKNSFLNEIYHHLIVSCQALEDEPLHGAEIMAKMAQAAKEGGAKAIRCNSVPDCIAIKKQTNLPVIAIIKRDYPNSEIYITPTLEEIKELLSVRPEVIALDATKRTRPHQEKLKDLVDYIHENSDTLVMGDIATLEDAKYAYECNVDILSSTLSGYTKETEHKDSPDFALVEELCRTYTIPIIAEGKINTPNEAEKMLELGAWSVVVGSAITRPQLITKTFVQVIEKKGDCFA
ncbi:N-acetylmannosamine-6-phosphate 2-epimerase [Pseudogracilibacillus auburnensis]|uniref:Putative N-acetylmannosamine-6-phosphate 2-epimerase n=1 Tax=Pseudogracilibacillus auburnensis TaxID=1494959 RepID=A0A2V3W776_9BACI|nr:N-acetylmannosamine-6-phosphate 2-epimerase [Pseudogracilibacillus auburnensis]PXW90167.1 N-acylglucosamine-6-phosphate 2-epimerase [Pseudogracilibacillus auburnensis]